MKISQLRHCPLMFLSHGQVATWERKSVSSYLLKRCLKARGRARIDRVEDLLSLLESCQLDPVGGKLQQADDSP